MTGMQWVWVWLAAMGGFTLGMIWAGYRRNCRSCEQELEELRESMGLGRRRWPSDDEKFEALLQGEMDDTELVNRLPLVAAVFRPIELDDESHKACP